MKVADLGEAGLIDLLAQLIEKSRDRKFTSWQQLIIGIGDDAAAWQGDNSIQLAKVDSLRENVHFTLGTFPWKELGWKALAINLSDIAAMGGIPRYALVSLALPGETEVDDVVDLYQGMIGCAGQFGVAIIGGDTDNAPLVDITVMVLGNTKSPRQTLLTRSSAQPGDKIAVTGELGAAAACVQMLKRNLQFDRETTISLKNAFFHPIPRLPEGQLLVEQGVRTAIDISDGLILDLGHICKANGVGARIEVARVPISPPVKKGFGERALELALSGGEDYELLFTASTEVMDKVRAKASCPITVIGEILAEKAGEITLVDENGKPFHLTKTGWDHFAQR